MEWAKREHIPALYLLPGNLNKWTSGDGDEFNSRFYLRYDVSAKRSGFKLQSNGLYGISLLTNGEQESILSPGEN